MADYSTEQDLLRNELSEAHRALMAVVAERDALKRGGEELGKFVEALTGLIRDAYRHGATDPIEAVHMLGNHLAEVFEDEGGLPIDEYNRVFRALEDQRHKRDALKAELAEVVRRTLNAAADKLHALPATDGAALKGPYWYRQGFTQAADLLRDWADYPAALDASQRPEDTHSERTTK